MSQAGPKSDRGGAEPLTISPAFSTARANGAFSDRNPYPKSSVIEETLQCGKILLYRHTWVDHLDSMFQSNLDNLVASEIGSYRGILTTLSDDVCLIGLLNMIVSSVFLTLLGLGISYFADAC